MVGAGGTISFVQPFADILKGTRASTWVTG
jgi:hypothetical protein